MSNHSSLDRKATVAIANNVLNNKLRISSGATQSSSILPKYLLGAKPPTISKSTLDHPYYMCQIVLENSYSFKSYDGVGGGLWDTLYICFPNNLNFKENSALFKLLICPALEWHLHLLLCLNLEPS